MWVSPTRRTRKDARAIEGQEYTTSQARRDIWICNKSRVLNISYAGVKSRLYASIAVIFGRDVFCSAVKSR